MAVRRRTQRRHGRAAARRDAGFTLTEMLVAMAISGVLVAVIATAISVMVRVTPSAEARLAESKDVTFLQTWIPVDLASAINAYDNPSDIVVRADLTANDPFVTYNATPPIGGTNVLTLVIPNPETGALEIVTYRYQQAPDGRWRLARILITNPGTASESRSLIGVAYEVDDPPDGWTPGQPVDFAFDITARNQAAIRPVGEDVTVTFKSGSTFRTGGAGLSAEQDLDPSDPVALPDPTAPPSRCGGRVALVLDTSFSVPGLNGGLALEAAATGFLDAFVGTPTEFTVQGFDAIAYQLYPNLNGIRGQYMRMLEANVTDADGNGRADIVDAKANITGLPDRDTPYPHSSSTYFQQPDNYYYGDGWATIGWTQVRTNENGRNYYTHPNGNNYYIWGGTNWEDALHAPFFDQAGSQRAKTPELVVWITDGDPNRERSDYFGGTAVGDDVAAAQRAANAGRSAGARIIGILVGPGGSTLEGKLAAVVGSNKWNGTGPSDLGNASTADYFASGFSQLGQVLKSIVAAQCGGTVTVRKGLTSGTPSGQWTYSTETGSGVLDLALASSVTFDFSFAAGEIERIVTITEEARAGYSFKEGQCSVGGVPISASSGRVVQRPDGIAGVSVKLKPDEAISCLMVSEVS